MPPSPSAVEGEESVEGAESVEERGDAAAPAIEPAGGAETVLVAVVVEGLHGC